jgi:Peptidoglycan-synthase activator LpoB
VRALRTVGTALVISAIVVLAGCSMFREKKVGNPLSVLPGFRGEPGLITHSVRSINTVIVNRIAVMPIIDAPNQPGATVPDGASEALTANIYSLLALAGGWDVVPESSVQVAMQQLPPPTARNLKEDALALGRHVGADAVLYGQLHTYRERVGYEYAAAKPAAVAFALYLVDVNLKTVVWSAEYAREQKALSQNFLDIFNFMKNKGRWITAQDIASEGAGAAVTNLRTQLPIPPAMQSTTTAAPAPAAARKAASGGSSVPR